MNNEEKLYRVIVWIEADGPHTYGNGARRVHAWSPEEAAAQVLTKPGQIAVVISDDVYGAFSYVFRASEPPPVDAFIITKVG